MHILKFIYKVIFFDSKILIISAETYLKFCDSLLEGEPLGVGGTYERSLFSACVLSRAFWKEHKRMGV